jgi:hypothetical protein
MVDDEQLVAALCDHFKIPLKVVTYAEKVEMLFIYRYVCRTAGVSSIADARPTLIALGELCPGRNKRLRMQRLFSYCQSRDIIDSGRYETAKAPPSTQQTHSKYEY